ncbi:phage tail protein, partial [Enterococcus cecorum]
MAFVGFKKATIAVLNGELKVVSTKKYVVEGKQGKGATSSFELSGLSSEAVKVYGSDVAYYVVQDGVGDPNMKLNLLDLPFDIENEILGTLKKSEGLFL